MANPTTNFGWQMPTATDLVTDLPADFEVFGQAVDTAFVDLLGGTTGQVLAKASDTDLDFVWSADAAGMTNPMTTTGDIIYSSSGSTPARLGIGLAADVLTVDGSGVPTWAAPAGGTTAYTLLNAGGTALSGASTRTITFTAKSSLAVYVVAATTGSTNQTINLRLNGDTGSNYDYAGAYITGSSPYAQNQQGITTYLPLGITAATSASELKAGINIYNANSTEWKIVNSSAAASFVSTATGNVGLNGYYKGTSAITSVTIYNTAANNFNGGTVYVYGAE